MAQHQLPKHCFSIAEMEMLNIEFTKADKNKDSTLSFDEFKCLIETTLGTVPDISNLFTLFDKNADGKITFEELLITLSVFVRGTPNEKLQFLFDFYDKNGDGVIASDEIKTLINHIKEDVAVYLGPGKEHQAQLEAEAILKKLDVNGDGKISRDEWIAFGSSDTNILKIFGLDQEN